MNDLISNVINDGAIDSRKFNFVIGKLRTFFLSKGYIECHTQSKLNVLAACEDPSTISTYEIGGKMFPQSQTQQMNLEFEIMNRPNVPGYFCVSTSFRNEKNPIRGRHLLAFPILEWESCGDMNTLIEIECELLKFLGYPEPVLVNYMDMCEKYGVSEISHKEEQMLYNDYGSAVLLMNFPRSSHPFWNMKENSDDLKLKDTFRKIDVILSGKESFGSAERETDVRLMRDNFFNISDGQYSQMLFNKFGEKRVMDELETYLELPFINRVGAGAGISRILSSMDSEGLLPNFD